MSSTLLELPHGSKNGRIQIESVKLRELNGHDERLLKETWNSPPTARVTALLERVTTLLDTPPDQKLDALRHLTIGDRRYILLNLRSQSFGNRIQSIISCPNCKTEISFDISVSELLRAATPKPGSRNETKIGDFLLSLRPVTGLDLETISENEVETNLIERITRECVVSSTPPLPEKLTPDLLSAIGSRLSELDPLADLTLNIKCPSCMTELKIPFLAEDFILREAGSRASQLEREVHWIAFNYHWSEEEILSLPVRRRKGYVELINKTLSGEDV